MSCIPGVISGGVIVTSKSLIDDPPLDCAFLASAFKGFFGESVRENTHTQLVFPPQRAAKASNESLNIYIFN